MSYSIMIVEDEYWIAMDLALEIQSHGATATGPFTSIPQAVEELRRPSNVDAVILDIGLRSNEVYLLADLLEQADVPFLFASAQPQDQLPERFADAPYFEKPFSTQDCVAAALSLAKDHAAQSAADGEEGRLQDDGEDKDASGGEWMTLRASPLMKACG